MTFAIDHDLEIEAPPEVVWSVLTAFERYGEWNPMAIECASTLVPGEPMDMKVRLLPGRPWWQREWVKTHTPGHEFSYSMKPLRRGVLRSRRSQTVEALADGRTRYVSHFELGGWLSPLVRLLLGGRLKRGFGSVVAGVRAQAEREGADR